MKPDYIQCAWVVCMTKIKRNQWPHIRFTVKIRLTQPQVELELGLSLDVNRVGIKFSVFSLTLLAPLTRFYSAYMSPQKRNK